MKKNAKPGYLIVSRDFIGDVLEDYTGGMTEDMAMLWLITQARYKNSNNLKRGELECTLSQFMNIFGWTRYKVRAFLQNLEKLKKISFRYLGLDNRRRVIRLNDYDRIMRNEMFSDESKSPRKEEPIKVEVTYDENGKPVLKTPKKRFHFFWSYYHEVFPEVPQIEFEMARKHWMKMSVDEHFEVLDSIKPFADKLTFENKKLACNYLRDKTYKSCKIENQS